MSAPETPRPTATSALVHWLALVAGLAALTVLRPGDADAVGALWTGSVVGTAVGQLFAWRRVRLWFVIIAAIVASWLAIPLVAGLHVAQTVRFAEIVMLPLTVAAFAGYLSLTERGALLAFWFPAVPWTLAMLQGGEGAALRGPVSVVLLVGLGALLLASLRARETRRVTLWETHANERLAAAATPIVLRTRPLRALGHVIWMTALGTAIVGVTTTVAPRLWGHEQLRAGVAAAMYGTRPCCPNVEGPPRERVSELVPLLDPAGVEPARPACTVCPRGAARSQPIGVTSIAGASATGVAGDAASADDSTGARASTDTWSRDATLHDPPAAPNATLVNQDAQQAPPSPIAAGSAVAPPAVGSPTTPLARAPAPALAPNGARASVPSTSIAEPTSVGSTRAERRASTFAAARERRPAGTFEDGKDLGSILAAAIALLASGLTLGLALRPIRRAVVLRHLRRPLWRETVDQRVSNLWQMMLVGLHDAGFRVAPGEQPLELARRVGLEGMTTCAEVLERARHGVRVDAADLEAMAAAADGVYAAARARAGIFARGAAALRWPLA